MAGSCVTPEVLALLCCPVTKQPLRLATPVELARLQPAPAAALVREDGQVAYPIHDGIPILIAEEAIPLGAA